MSTIKAENNSHFGRLCCLFLKASLDSGVGSSFLPFGEGFSFFVLVHVFSNQNPSEQMNVVTLYIKYFHIFVIKCLEKDQKWND